MHELSTLSIQRILDDWVLEQIGSISASAKMATEQAGKAEDIAGGMGGGRAGSREKGLTVRTEPNGTWNHKLQTTCKF